HGGEAPGGLEETPQTGGLNLGDRVAINRHALERGDDGGGGGQNLFVQGDAAVLDHALDIAAAANASAGQKLRDALGFMRVESGLGLRLCGSPCRAGSRAARGAGRGCGPARRFAALAGAGAFAALPLRLCPVIRCPAIRGLSSALDRAAATAS